MSDIEQEIRKWRGQLQAIELCRAASAGDESAAHVIFDKEARSGTLRELTGALTTFTVSLAGKVAVYDDSIDEAAIWSGLAERAKLGLLATAEIDQLTRDPGPELDNNEADQ